MLAPNGRFEDFESVLQSLVTTFAKPNKKAAAIYKLRNLKQRGSIAKYNADFVTLNNKVDYGKDGAKDAYYNGLQESTKDLVREHLNVAALTLEDLMREATTLDSCNYTRKMEKRGGGIYGGGRGYGYQPRTFATNTGDDGSTPMEIDLLDLGEETLAAVQPLRRTLADAAERQRHRDQRLCFGCYQPGHIRAQCPRATGTKNA